MTSEIVYPIHLHGEHIGQIARRDRFTKFTFDADYWDRPDRPVLGRWFEDHPRRSPHSTNTVPSWFSNLLPEGRLRVLIAKEQGVGIHQEMDLLERIGRDLSGAVEVLPHSQMDDIDESESMSPIFPRTPAQARAPRRASLAGMALKFAMSLRGDRLAIPAHDEEADWILKTPDPAFPRLPENEFTVMRLAREVGIDVPDVTLWHRDSVDNLGEDVWSGEEDLAYVIRRFDRSETDRIHIEDFAQVIGQSGLNEGKYGSSVETVAGLAFRGSDKGSLREMIRRTVFNLLVGNGDAHLKNWSLIYPDRRRGKISPAYDLVCTAAYPNHSELGLPFYGHSRIDQVDRSTFQRLQKQLGVTRTEVLDVVDDTLERFHDVRNRGLDFQIPHNIDSWISAHEDATKLRLAR